MRSPRPSSCDGSRTKKPAGDDLRSFLRESASVLRDPASLLLAAAFGLYTFQYFAIAGFLPVLLVSALHLELAAASLITTLAVIANACGNIAAGVLQRSGVPLWLNMLVALAVFVVAAPLDLQRRPAAVARCVRRGADPRGRRTVARIDLRRDSVFRHAAQSRHADRGIAPADEQPRPIRRADDDGARGRAFRLAGGADRTDPRCRSRRCRRVLGEAEDGGSARRPELTHSAHVIRLIEPPRPRRLLDLRGAPRPTIPPPCGASSPP